jgi:iron complex transport system substrate-binding protein
VYCSKLQPDLILTQNLCAVCAVSADNVNEQCATDAEIVALDANTLAEIKEGVEWAPLAFIARGEGCR